MKTGKEIGGSGLTNVLIPTKTTLLGTCKKARPVKAENHNLHSHLNPLI